MYKSLLYTTQVKETMMKECDPIIPVTSIVDNDDSIIIPLADTFIIPEQSSSSLVVYEKECDPIIPVTSIVDNDDSIIIPLADTFISPEQSSSSTVVYDNNYPAETNNKSFEHTLTLPDVPIVLVVIWRYPNAIDIPIFLAETNNESFEENLKHFFHLADNTKCYFKDCIRRGKYRLKKRIETLKLLLEFFGNDLKDLILNHLVLGNNSLITLNLQQRILISTWEDQVK